MVSVLSFNYFVNWKFASTLFFIINVKLKMIIVNWFKRMCFKNITELNLQLITY